MQQPKVAAIDVTQPREAFEQSFVIRRFFFRVASMPKIGNSRNFLARLGVGNEGRCGQRSTEQAYKFPPSHSITSSASVSRFGGILRSSALAVARLITRSSLVASC